MYALCCTYVCTSLFLWYCAFISNLTTCCHIFLVGLESATCIKDLRISLCFVKLPVLSVTCWYCFRNSLHIFCLHCLELIVRKKENLCNKYKFKMVYVIIWTVFGERITWYGLKHLKRALERRHERLEMYRPVANSKSSALLLMSSFILPLSPFIR